MDIKQVNKQNINPKLEKQISLLFKQLSPAKKQLNIVDILESDNTIIAYCLHKENVVGIALMANYKVISGNKGWIEDVVVDSDYRGKGIGKMLIQYLIEEAKTNSYSQLFLFTEPEKEAAIHLYTKLGFEKRTSMLFDIKF